MTNKEYRQARQAAETANELYTFEHWNGICIYPNRYMTGDDIKELRDDLKAVKTAGGYALNGMNGRAVIIPDGDVVVLRSYYTNVCSYNIKTNEFKKLWGGFSVTTLKHINLFRRFLALETLSKREWIELTTEV